MTDSVPFPSRLSGLDFPVSREDLIRQAQELGADTALLRALRSLPVEQVHSADELTTMLGAPG